MLSLFFIVYAVTSSSTLMLEEIAMEDTPLSIEAIPSKDKQEGSTKLNIQDLGQSPKSPGEGWCGEAAIQQALLFYGAYFPQDKINQTGSPNHQDLYSGDLPRALRGLKAAHSRPPNSRNLDEFLCWIKKEIDQGRPVLTGMKIYPSAHPDWSLDHFTLVVGYQGDALVVNTTWKDQRILTKAALLSTNDGLALSNPFDFYFGMSILGSAATNPISPQTRLFVEAEKDNNIHAIIKCEGLTEGQEFRLTSADSFDGTQHVLTTFLATGPVHAFRYSFANDRPAVFRCAAAKNN